MLPLGGIAYDGYLFFDPETASGSDIGLMLMFLFGLRNGEACGLRFGGIHTFENGHEAFFITYSVKAGTDRIQLGGKTRNAFRAIPLYPFVTSFLRKRRAWAMVELKKSKLEDRWVEAGLQGFSIPMIGEICEVVDTVTGEYAVYFDHMVALAEKEKEAGADETACADPSEDAGEETGEGS